jgi:hypothetical protein
MFAPLNVSCGSTVSPSRHQRHMSFSGALHRVKAACVSGGSEYMWSECVKNKRVNRW